MKHGYLKKLTALVMAGAIIVSTAPVFGLGQESTQTTDSTTADNTETVTVSQDSSGSDRLTTCYTKVSAGYTASDYTGEEITVSDVQYDLSHGDTVTITVEVPETALYLIGFNYFSYDSSILPIEFALEIDGSIPFYECRSLTFETTWVSSEKSDTDRYGNEIVTLPDKVQQWEKKYLSDASYRYSEPLKVELTKGTHTFLITVNEGTFYLGDITLAAPTYVTEYTGSEKAEGSELITIECEEFSYRNDSSIHATFEFDSALSPLSTSKKVLNLVDSDSFDTAGMTVGYTFHVDKAGYYNIAVNYRQSDKNDFPVFIDYRIDGEIPNSAFQNYSMEYTTKFRNEILTDDEGNRLSVYLTEGDHEISLTINASYLREALETVDAIMNGINDLSLEVTKVAGTNKDKYRDLKITRYIPDIEETLNSWIEQLYAVAESATQFVDTDDPEDVAAYAYLIIAAKQLKSLAEEPNDIIYRVDELSTSVNSINTQIANFVDIINDHNISLDRIYICQEETKLPKKLNFFKSLGMSVMRFINSFFGQSYSASNTDETHIQVWVNRPRQYVEIMQKMIDEEFTPATGIEVDLSIMTDVNKLVLSNASGDTPDVATGINYAFPFELGIRDALVDMTKFDDYKEVFSRFSEGLLVASCIDDSLIALPETMNFYVMFYRTDILEKLGMTVPDTIDDLIAMLPDLQMRGLNVYYPTASMLSMRNFHGVTPLIFQSGGSLYGDTALDLMVDSEATVQGFTTLTELFTLYNLPVDVPNFYQHFRNGDLPIGIADFNSYNLILNAAPEIANSWEIALVPGVVDEETGEVVRYMSGGAESSVMFKTTDEREEQAWEFLKWWSSADVQAEFGQMLQIMYGDEYIWPTANLEAFERLPFPSEHKEIILEQAENILEAPRLLGSYMLERELSNAFNDIVVNGDNLRSRLDEVVKTVNRETSRKLEEFGYIDSDGNIIKDYYVPNVEKIREILGRE